MGERHRSPHDASPRIDDDTPATTAGGLWEVARVFLQLGLVSFGGPVAHLAYLRAALVEKRRWIDDAHYGDIVALCQFLPGPASSQVVFALGMHRAGFLGALLASLCFLLPSAFLMIAFAAGVSVVDTRVDAGWLHGLKLAAVAVVAQAVWGMGQKLCSDRARITLCLVAASLLLAWPGAVVQIGVLGSGALAGAWIYRRSFSSFDVPIDAGRRGAHVLAVIALIVFALLLCLLPVLASSTGNRTIALVDSFYRAGSLVFGGGHVVLPLLRAELVPQGWLTDDQFLAGYGAVQAMPGPLFSFAAYLGAVIAVGGSTWGSGLLCLLAIYVPAWLLVGGALPFWHRLRAKAWTQSALAGANAAVVGVLLAALVDPVITDGIHGPTDVAAALVAFGLLETWRAPAWLVVVAAAAAGQWLLP